MIDDIPAPWWIRLILVRVVRFLRTTSWGRYIVFSIKNRSHLGFVSKLHQQAIHDVRNITVAQLMDANEDSIISIFQNIANSYRDVMADIIESPPEEIHCTIKIFIENDATSPEKYEVYTLVRSEDTEGYWHGRPLEFGSSCFHVVGENSSFAALLGIRDRKNDWSSNAYTCFISNNLDSCEKYDSSGNNWKSHYNSTAVFPIRFKYVNEEFPHILGFITFDAKNAVFGKQCIFKTNSPSEYYKQVKALSLFHIGGIMADLLYPSLAMYQVKEQEISQ